MVPLLYILDKCPLNKGRVLSYTYAAVPIPVQYPLHRVGEPSRQWLRKVRSCGSHGDDPYPRTNE